jgi:hypothetical protein
MRHLILTFIAVLLFTHPARADDVADWTGGTRRCLDGVCRNIPNTDEALDAAHEILAESQAQGDADPKTRLSRRTLIGIGAAASVTAGGAIVYGVGKRAAYDAAVKEAAAAASILRRETARVAKAVASAFEPELARFGQALIRANESRAASGAAQLGSEDVMAALGRGLRTPEVRERIIARLRRTLGNAAETAFERVTDEGGLQTMEYEVRAAARYGKILGLEGAVEKVGESMAVRVGEKVAPLIARYTARAAISAAAAAARGGIMNRCLVAIGRAGGAGLEVAGSAWFAGLLVLLEPSTADAATLDAMYYEHPEELLSLPEPELRSWLEHSPGLRMKMMTLRDVMSQAGELGSKQSVDESGDTAAQPSAEACFAPSPAPGPVAQPVTVCH